MPRLRYIEESEKTPASRAMIESAERTGAPDPRVVSIMTRSTVERQRRAAKPKDERTVAE